MKCKNCGAELRANSDICPNCGTQADDYYVLVSADYEADDYRKSTNTITAKKSNVRYVINAIISFILVLALVGGSYYYFQQKHLNQEAPKLEFTTGTGIINDREIVYIKIKDSSKIEFIQGASIYDGDLLNDSSLKKSTPISTKYEYTKNAGDSFRAIFFYADDINVEKSKNYTYTFELVFSFLDDNQFYTYLEPVSFSGDINKKISGTIFDHSLNDNQQVEFNNTQTTTQATTESTTVDLGDRNFIFNVGYCYTEPVKEGSNKSISVWEFKEDKTINVTEYKKSGNEKWTTKKVAYKFVRNGIKMVVMDKDGNRVSVVRADPSNKTIVLMDKRDAEEVSIFTTRKSNDIKTVEAFFK